MAPGGTQTSSLAGGGSDSLQTEEYDGTSWSLGGNMVAAMTFCSGAGTQTSAAAFGGLLTRSSNTQLYNGTSWSSAGGFITPVELGAASGSQSSAMFAGGFRGRWSSPTNVTQTFDSSVTNISKKLTITPPQYLTL
jgi:hypothetical protein